MRAVEFINEEIVDEARAAPLYHNMTDEKARAVFSNDSLPANWQSNIPGLGRVNGNSFTRNKEYGTEYTYGGYIVRLVVDQAKLAQTHKIVPVNAELLQRQAATNNSRLSGGLEPSPHTEFPRSAMDRNKRDPRERMDEEFVIGDINNLHRYVVGIQVPSAAKTISTGLAKLITDYSKQFKIPVTGDAVALDALRKANNRAKASIKRGQPGFEPVAHPDPATIADKWEKWHNPPVDPKRAAYNKSPEGLAAQADAAAAIARLKAQGKW